MKEPLFDELRNTLQLALSQIPPQFIVEPAALEASHPFYLNWLRVRIVIEVNVPTSSEFPSKTILNLYIDRNYPGAYAVIPEDKSIAGYPHQETNTRKLCIEPDFVIGFGPDRIWNIIRSTKKWLDAAANNQLAKADEPYELPDFPKNNSTPRLLFSESNREFIEWNKLIPSMGLCELAHIANHLYFVKQFDAAAVPQIDWGALVTGSENSIVAGWVLVKDEPSVLRRQPCLSRRELERFLEVQKIDIKKYFVDIHLKADALPENDIYSVLLIGFPIPKKNSEAPFEIHWQPCLIESYKRLARFKVKGYREGNAPPDLLFEMHAKKEIFKSDNPIIWARSINIAYSRFFGRGQIDEMLVSKKIAVFGVGAIGAHLCEILVREGVRKMVLYDPDRVEAGNVFRHTTHLGTVDGAKVNATARKLTVINPYLNLEAFEKAVPISESDDSFANIVDADLLFDCTASPQAQIWEDALISKYSKQVVKIYITLGAGYLCMYGNGKNRNLSESHSAITSLKGKDIPDDFFDVPAEMHLEGAGCFHPTFPARLDKILALLAFGMQHLPQLIAQQDAWAFIVGYENSPSCKYGPNIRTFYSGTI